MLKTKLKLLYIFFICFCYIQFLLAEDKNETNVKYITLWGKVIVASNKEVRVYPRYAGVVKEVFISEGNKVKNGDILAKIESNTGLQIYSIIAPMDGIIAKKNMSKGEFVNQDKEVLLLMDNQSIKISLNARQNDLSHIFLGKEVNVFDADRSANFQVKGKIFFISPILDTKTRAATVLVDLNPNNYTILPGQQVFAQIEKK